jgi:hypothetical protein
MNDRLNRLLAERKPTRNGVHGTGNAYESQGYYASQFRKMQESKVAWFKSVGAGDSQVNTFRRLQEIAPGIIGVLRPYDTSCPRNVIDQGLLRPYIAAGVVVVESPFNEFYYQFENSWGAALRSVSLGAEYVGGDRPGQIRRADLSRLEWPPTVAKRSLQAAGMPSDWPEQVARGWSQFANEVLQAGGIPTTPAIEGWRFETIFVPLFRILVDKYADLLTQSIVAMHNRPLNHPIDYDEDTGCWLAWTRMDRWIQDALGFALPLMATEAHSEPGWDQDRRSPRVTPQIHADRVIEVLDWPAPDNYIADIGWLWHGDGAWRGASWTENAEHMGGKDLPVVQRLKDWQPLTPQPPALTDAAMRALAEAHGQEIRIFTGGKLYKTAQERGLGYPVTNEWPEQGRLWQRFENPAQRTKSVVSCREKTYDDVRVVTWEMEV